MYHPEVAEIERAGVNLIEKFEDFLMKHRYQGEEAQYFLQFLNSYRKPSFEYSQIRFVLMGRSGVGKSSLLNTLLGYEGLSVYVSSTSPRLATEANGYQGCWRQKRHLRHPRVPLRDS